MADPFAGVSRSDGLFKLLRGALDREIGGGAVSTEKELQSKSLKKLLAFHPSVM